MSNRDKCNVRDGRFVEPCSSLDEATDVIAPAFTQAKGIAVWQWTNTQTRTPSRTFYGIKSKAFPKGMAFNYCPFCGVAIDGPFEKQDDAARAAQQGKQ